MLSALVLSGRAGTHLLAHIGMSRLLYSQLILLATCCYNGLCSPGPQYSISSSCFNDSLSWLILKLNKARNGLILRLTHRCLQIYRIPLRRCRRRRPATETGVNGRPIIVSSYICTSQTLLFLLLKFCNSSGYFIRVNATLGQELASHMEQSFL